MKTAYKGMELDVFQAEAIDALDGGASVIVAAPTGSGKTLIAEYAVDKALASGTRLIYTAPIKALSNQKYRDLRAQHGDRIGIVTGDVSINPDAPILIMTTEIFRNEIFESPRKIASVEWAVFDEIHYMDDGERGTVWEESIIFAPDRIKFVCLSATIPNLMELAAWMRTVRPGPLKAVLETKRPVPLRHRLYVHGMGFVPFKKMNEAAAVCKRKGAGRKALNRDDGSIVDEVIAEGKTPILYFAFQRKRTEELANARRRTTLLSEDESARALSLFDGLCMEYEVSSGDPVAERMRRLVSAGVAYHHAGLLPTLKDIVERLFQAGLVKLLVATETFALGINMPAASVVFDTLEKFDGIRFSPLMTRDYFQMAGRAGRRGMDEVGYVYGQSEPRFFNPTRIRETVFGEVEPVKSRFNLGYSTILNLYSRIGDGIFKVARKSLAAFQDRSARGGARAAAFERIIAARLSVLGELGYLDGQVLLPRGAFAASAPGSEMQLTEMLFSGALEDLGPDYLNVALTAIVFEPRRGEEKDEVDTPESRRLEWAAESAVARVLRAEKRHGITERVKEPDFSLSKAVLMWSGGTGFEEIAAETSIDPGDLVRAFRMAIQLVRQLRSGRGVSPGLRETAEEALSRMNRGVVDAERQLKRG